MCDRWAKYHHYQKKKTKLTRWLCSFLSFLFFSFLPFCLRGNYDILHFLKASILALLIKAQLRPKTIVSNILLLSLTPYLQFMWNYFLICLVCSVKKGHISIIKNSLNFSFYLNEMLLSQTNVRCWRPQGLKLVNSLFFLKLRKSQTHIKVLQDTFKF